MLQVSDRASPNCTEEDRKVDDEPHTLFPPRYESGQYALRLPSAFGIVPDGIKEATLKPYALIALGCLSAAAWAADVPEIPFDSVPNFLKLPPDMYFGEVSGVAVNSKKHIFVYNRGNTTGPAYGATASQLLEFGPDGKFIREIGKNLYAWSFAHDVRVDKDDNIWAIDKGSDMIIRFNPEGRVTMVFGRKKEASDEARSRGSIRIRHCRRLTASSASLPTWPGTRRATSSSATATSIRGWPSMTRMATG